MKKIYSPWKKRFWSAMLIALTFSLAANATVWPIPNTATDTLLKFVIDTSKWEPGDTIMVAEASVYSVYGTIDFFQEGTIMGNPELTTKPTLKFEDNGFRAKEDTISISIIGLKLDGYKTDGTRANFAIRFDQGAWQNWNDITIKDCEIWGFTGVAQLFKNKWAIYESFKVDNCLIYDIAGNYAIDPKLNAVKSLSVTNSTFYDITAGFITNLYYAADGRNTIDQTVTIDHNTFFNVAGSNWNKSLVQMNDATDGSIGFTFSNNIVQQLYNEEEARAFMINELAGDFMFKYSVFYDYYSTYDGGKWNLDTLVQNLSNVDTFNIYKDDPMFADTASRHFNLPTNSPLLTAGSDGGAIGDPRWVPGEKPWVPGPNCHLIYNDSSNILKAWVDTLPGGSHRYNAGDTLILASASQYSNISFCYVTEDVVIMGDPRLSVKPSLYCIDFGFRIENDTTSLELNNFDVIGWDPADSSGAANYFIQYRNAGGENLKVKGMDCVGFKSLFYLQNGENVYDTIIVDDCVIHGIGAGSYNTFDFRQAIITYASITNSTVYGEPRGICGEFYNWDNPANAQPMKIILDHNTFYNVVGDASFIAFEFNDDDALDITISNNIISTLNKEYTRPFRYNTNAGSVSMQNNVFHNFIGTRIDAGKYYGFVQDSIDKYYPGLATQANTDTANPYFADPLAGSFMLADSSSLLSASTIGGPIGDPRWVPVAGVTINTLTESVVEGSEVTLTAEVNVSGDDKSVTWSVSNGTGTATIDASTGVLSALTPGTVTVTATSNFNSSFTDELEITIEVKIFVTGIVLTSTDSKDKPTDEITNSAGFLNINASIVPGSAHDKSLTWHLSEKSDGKATLTEVNPVTAKLIAIQCGTVYVVAKANDGSEVKDSIEITISGQTSVESITVTAEGGNTKITTDDGTLQMIATITPDTACVKVVEWSVSNKSIATIDESSGLLSAVNNGTITVTARATDGSYKTGALDITISNQITPVNDPLADEMLIMPNPATDFIFVQSEHTAEVIMTNIVGTVVLSTVVDPNTSIDISNLKAGVYIINVKSGNKVTSIKLIKE